MPVKGGRQREGLPPAQLCDWCEQALGKTFDVFWVAGTAGFDSRGEPFIGAMTRMLLCHKCGARFTRALGFAWEREADRTSGRNLATMPDLSGIRERPKPDGDLQDVVTSGNRERDGVPGGESTDAHDEGGGV